MKVLVVASHFDDEVLGVGGTIVKHVKNRDEAYVCFLTDSSSAQYPNNPEMIEIKRKESQEAGKILGIKKSYYFDLPDMRLDTLPIIEVTKCIERCTKEIQPETVYTHFKGDSNRDHKIAFESTLVATRPLGNNPVKRIFCYGPPAMIWGESFTPNVFVDISDTIKNKLAAIKAYKSELRKHPHPRSVRSIKSIARNWGIHSGIRFAEAFICERMIL